ncbi:MAG: hypothetical protein AAF492_28150, partial [Verrucomicrobiota bacterium]
MKNQTNILLVITLATSIASTSAQVSPGEPPLTDTEPNPFKRVQAEPIPHDGRPVNLLVEIEHILVAQKTLSAWELANDKRSIQRDDITPWLTQDEARIAHTVLLTSLYGFTIRNFSGMELIYPTEFDPLAPDAWPLPTAFETRNLGYEEEFVLLANDHHGFTANVNISRSTYAGSVSHHALIERTRQASDVLIPRIESSRVDGQTQLRTGERRLIGRIAPEAGATDTRLIFMRSEAVPVDVDRTQNEVKRCFRVGYVSFQGID